MNLKTCHNCGIPSDIFEASGRFVVLHLQPSNRFCRATKKTVWCCSGECCYQALAIAAYGPASHKWPITLAEFKALNPLPDRTETIAETRINTGAKSGECDIMAPLVMEGVSVRKTAFKRKGGRPKKWTSEAVRLRAYREQRKVQVL
jgi:hypothetical protein